MKLQNEIQEKDKISVERTQFEKKLKLEKRIFPKENHKCFEYNKSTNELNLAEYMEEPILKWENAIKGNFSMHRKILKKENCIYFTCLNFKNAIKVLKRDYGVIIKI